MRNGLMILAILSLLAAGCGGGNKLPPLAPVKGKVSVDGQPLTRGMVQFSPDTTKGASGPTAVGPIDASGNYELTTDGQSGAMVGPHRVSVVARAEPKNEMDTLPPSLIADKFSQPSTSGLSFEVIAGQTNTIDLPLTAK